MILWGFLGLNRTGREWLGMARIELPSSMSPVRVRSPAPEKARGIKVNGHLYRVAVFVSSGHVAILWPLRVSIPLSQGMLPGSYSANRATRTASSSGPPSGAPPPGRHRRIVAGRGRPGHGRLREGDRAVARSLPGRGPCGTGRSAAGRAAAPDHPGGGSGAGRGARRVAHGVGVPGRHLGTRRPGGPAAPALRRGDRDGSAVPASQAPRLCLRAAAS